MEKPFFPLFDPPSPPFCRKLQTPLAICPVDGRFALPEVVKNGLVGQMVGIVTADRDKRGCRCEALQQKLWSRFEAAVVGELEEGHRLRRIGSKESGDAGLFQVAGQEDAFIQNAGVKDERIVVQGVFRAAGVVNRE